MEGGAGESRVADAPWYHGGNLNAARRLFPDAPEPWIDLSTGINPVPYPVGDLAADSWARLPEPSDLNGLETAARQAYGAGQDAEIIAAPGTQAIIQWLPYLFAARRVGVLGHTYAEHEQSWRTCGAEIIAEDTLDGCESCDVVVVVNPNNPDGRLVAPDSLTALAGRLGVRGGLLVVDEAFMDVLPPAASLIPALPDRTIILRSFGKSYGLAGLRLGFAVASPPLGGPLRQALGPWAVSGPAIAIGRAALSDRAWLAATARRLVEEAARLDALLARAGFTVAGGTPLFRLADHPDAGVWFARLGRAGILTRPFSQRPSALRFGIPCNRSDWERLEAALLSGPALF